MKILLIFPPSTIYGNDPTIPAIVVPLGLAYIASYLQRHGYNVYILDARLPSQDKTISSVEKQLYGLTENEICNRVGKIGPDVVGISCMYTAYSGDTHKVAKIVKGIDKNIPVVIGGAHASAFSGLVLKDNNVDIVVHGEGEATFLELIKCFENNKDYFGIKGISFRMEQGEVVTNPQRAFIEDLDTIPFPARDLLDMNLYLENKPGPYTMRAPSTTMITSRGCPNECIYCTIHSVWGKRKWRGRSSKNVVDEIELLLKKYGINEVHLMDDSIGTSKQRLAEICLEIIRRRLDVKWTVPNGIAHWYLDERVLSLMKEAGCYRITFGIESGNKQTREFLGKPFSLKQAERMIHFANKIGMWTICTFIIGFPFETEGAILDTINFACSSEVDMAVFYLLCPHPGTKVYDIFKAEGLLNLDYIMDPSVLLETKDFEEMGLRLAGRGAKTKYFTPGELQCYLNLAYKRFFKASLKHFMNPSKIIKKIKNTEDFIYVCKLGKIGIKMVFKSISSGSFMSQDMWRHRKASQDTGIKEIN